MKIYKQISELSNKVQIQINYLYSKDSNNEIFEQEGFLNGSQFVKEFLDEEEWGLAVKHLLYMVCESNIVYPKEIIEELNSLVSKYKIENPYY